MSDEPTALLLHRDTQFDDQIVYLTGNAYIRCSFTKCIMILKGSPATIEGCDFHGCVWHVDAVFHDRGQFKHFMDVFAPMIAKSVPFIASAPADEPNQQ